QVPRADLTCCAPDRVRDLGREQAQLLIRGRGRLLHGSECIHQCRVLRDGDAGHREVLHGTQRLNAVVDVVRYVPLAEQVLLPAGLARDVRLTPADQPGVRLAQATGNDLGGDGDQLAVQRRLFGRESLEDLAWNLEHL